jgi:hypothetical protein
MRTKIAGLFMVLIVSAPVAGWTATTQVDALIHKLVQKGILSETEAEGLKEEVALDEKKAMDDQAKKTVPSWVQDVKVGGDLRVRHQWEHRNDAADLDRNRGRIRARVNLETKINDKAKAVIGIATDGGTPRSTNSSFGGSFAKGNIVLNKAFGQYMPNDRLTLTLGKMDNPIWEPIEFLWDSDITPEGGALRYEQKINDALGFSLLATAFQISEISGNEADPFMYVLQASGVYKLGEKADVKLVGAFNGMDNVTKTQLSNRSTLLTNSTNAAGQYIYHYTQPILSTEIGLNDPLGKQVKLPRAAVFGTYTENPDPDEQNTAWMAGVYLGHVKVSGWGAWRVFTAYKSIGRDAWLDTFPDADLYSGATDVKGYETGLEIGLAKNLSLSFDYYRSQRIKTTKAPESVFQTDVNFKF